MVRRSPTAFEGGYMFYHNIAKNILLVFQLGESEQINLDTKKMKSNLKESEFM